MQARHTGWGQGRKGGLGRAPRRVRRSLPLLRIRGGGSGRGRGLIPHCCVLVCSPVSLGAVTGSHQDAQSHATPPGPSHFRSTPQPPEEPERGLGGEGKWELRQDGKQVWRAPARTRLALGGGTKGKRQNWVRWRGPLGFGGGTLIQDRVRSSLL